MLHEVGGSHIGVDVRGDEDAVTGSFVLMEQLYLGRTAVVARLKE